jgi:hypothetical protein
MGFGVKRDVVIKALRAKRLGVVPLADDYVEIAGLDGELTTEYLPTELGRREPQRLSELYAIPIQWFYYPLMIPGEEDKRTPC